MPTTEQEKVIQDTVKAASTTRKKATKSAAPTDVFEDSPTTVLLKMDRKNVAYEVRGVRFTKEHPFAVTDEETALRIMAEVDGIRFASPLEAREYYS